MYHKINEPTNTLISIHTLLLVHTLRGPFRNVWSMVNSHLKKSAVTSQSLVAPAVCQVGAGSPPGLFKWRVTHYWVNKTGLIVSKTTYLLFIYLFYYFLQTDNRTVFYSKIFFIVSVLLYRQLLKSAQDRTDSSLGRPTGLVLRWNAPLLFLCTKVTSFSFTYNKIH